MPPEKHDRARPAPSTPPATPPAPRVAPGIADQPWWAAVLLTVAEVADRPSLALAVWVVVISRSVPRALDRVRRGRARTARRASAIVEGARPHRPGPLSAPGPPGVAGIAAAVLDISRPAILGPCGNHRRMICVQVPANAWRRFCRIRPTASRRGRAATSVTRSVAPHRRSTGPDRVPTGSRPDPATGLGLRWSRAARETPGNSRADPARRWIFDAVAQRDLAGVRSHAVGVVMHEPGPENG